MKKWMIVLLAMALLVLPSCSGSEKRPALDTPADVRAYLLEGNRAYVKSEKNTGNISSERRADTAENGQKPYAVVVTCSDSRVPAEHIFQAGIGDLFVIRTAGNVIGEFELGSVEYGAEHLGTPLVVVLGHTQCGAVDAALSGGAHGAIASITDEINACVPAGTDAREAEILNVQNSISRILESEAMAGLVKEGKVAVVGAVYDIVSGEVRFLD